MFFHNYTIPHCNLEFNAIYFDALYCSNFLNFASSIIHSLMFLLTCSVFALPNGRTVILKHTDGFFCGVGRYTVDLCHPDCFRLSKSWSFPTLQLDHFCAFCQTPDMLSLDSFWGMAPCCHPPHTTVFCRTSAMVCYCVFTRLSTSKCCRSCRVIVVWSSWKFSGSHSFERWPILGNVWVFW